MGDNFLGLKPFCHQKVCWVIALLIVAVLALVVISGIGWMNLPARLPSDLFSADEAKSGIVNEVQWLMAWVLGILPVIALTGTYIIHRLLRRISDTHARSHVILQSIADAVVVTDAKGQIEYLNSPAQQLLGLSLEESQGKPVDELLRMKWAGSGQLLPNPIERLQNNAFAVESNGPVMLHTSDGRVVPIEDRAAPVRDEQGRLDGAVVVLRDISAQQEARQQIQDLVYHDQLTGLPNRRLLQDRVESSIALSDRHQGRIALMMVDLDHFKIINDTLGHEMGDHILLIAGGRLMSCVREQDTIARVGGDEFVVMLPDIQEASEAAQVAQKIIEVLSFPYQVDGADLHSTPSIGISLYPDDGEDFSMLMKHADAAMYHSKEAGRAAYRFYTLDMHERSMERLTIENNLHRALQYDQFELYYQPKVDIREGLLVGAEALIRWNHPELGLIPPGKFIPVAEESGIINAIGEWVLYSASRQMRRWSDMGLQVREVSVNISARQLLYGDLPRLLRQIIDDTGVNPHLLELELTESVLMQPQEVEGVLAECKAMGFRIALDDFGTGYSSLSYLRRMAIDTLKIDRSFVADLESNPDDVAIVQTIISMARNLRMNVIAEGVETSAQAEILLQNGCEYCQGYYYGKPQPLDSFAALLQRSCLLDAALQEKGKTQPGRWLEQARHLSGMRRHRYLI